MAPAGQTKTKGVPTQADILIGERLKQARIYAGMSQSTLAGAVNITFQQLQKYEGGKNRVAATRLLQFAMLLGRPVGWFYEPVINAAESGEIKLFAGAGKLSATAEDERHIYRAGKVICEVANPKIRQHLLGIAKEVNNSLATPSEPPANP